MNALLNPDDPLADLGEFFKYCGIVTGDDQPRGRGELFHAVLGAQVGSSVKSLGDGHMFFKVFIEIHVVTGKNYGAGPGIDADKL